MDDPDGWFRRAVVEQLESLRLAGVTHWLPVVPPAAATPAAEHPPAAPTTAAPPKPTGILTLDRRGIAGPQPSGTPPESKPLARSAPSESTATAMPKSPLRAHWTATPPTTCMDFTPLSLRRGEREKRLVDLAQQVAKCTRCTELARTRTQTVFGVGDPQAKIAFVGEAPGADEDEQGEPFVGRAGQLLNDIIKACKLKREDIYICNVLRCRPPGNRLPSPEEADNCREFLHGQLAVVNPDYIVCWGSTAAQNLLQTTATIGKLRGQFFGFGRAKLLCTYHPSYLLRNPAAKKDVWADMQFLFADMGIKLSAK